MSKDMGQASSGRKHADESAMAQLLVYTSTTSTKDHGSEVSLEELAALHDDKLTKKRREQVLAQLEANTELYEAWLAMDIESQTVSDLNLKPASGSNSNFIEIISRWIASVFTPQGAFTSGLGMALGVLAVFVLVKPTTVPDASDSMRQSLVLNNPIMPINKASVAITSKTDFEGLFKCGESDGRTLCISNTLGRQHWFYWDVESNVIALDSPLQVDKIREVRFANGCLFVVSEDVMGVANISILALEQANDAGITIKTKFDFRSTNPSIAPIEITDLRIGPSGAHFQVLGENGRRENITFRFQP